MKKTLIIFAVVVAGLSGGSMLRATPAVALTHEEICQANYDQCIKGCDGAASCNNQCQTNKDQCNNQGQ